MVNTYGRVPSTRPVGARVGINRQGAIKLLRSAVWGVNYPEKP